MRILTTIKLSPHKYKTPEGYLVCQDAILARTGKQDYYKSEIYEDFDGEDEVVSVDRLPEQVFSTEAMASFENKPITVEHPDESVGPDNWDRLAVGNVRNVRKGTYNGQEVMMADLVINRADAIEDIESGVRTELSCGYDCDITEGPNPQQINIRGNHIALCEAGRAGIAKIVDSKPAEIEEDKYEIKLEKGCYNVYRNGKSISSEDNKSDAEKAIEEDKINRAKLHHYNVTYVDKSSDSTMEKEMEAHHLDELNKKIKKDKSIYRVIRIDIIDSLTNDIQPKKYERQEDFIKRFMEETKEEYPDEKQRVAVAYSYWNRAKGIKDEALNDSSIVFESFKTDHKYLEYSWDKHDGFMVILGNKTGEYTVREYLRRYCSSKEQAKKLFDKYKKELEKSQEITDEALPGKDKSQLKKYLAAISKHMLNDVKIEDIIQPIEEMGFSPVREKIEGWYEIADGFYRKDYYFLLDGFDDLMMISLYADANNDWKVNEVNAYFVGKKDDLYDSELKQGKELVEDSIKDSKNKYVIYKENGKLKGTGYDNYSADIMNANRIQSYDDFENAEQLIEYLLDYTNVKREDIITICDSNDLDKVFAKKRLKELEKQKKKLEKEDEQVKDENRELAAKAKGKLKENLDELIEKTKKELEDSINEIDRKIKEWYIETYPTDSLGHEINEDITFNDLFETLDARQSVYELLGNSIDSIIRERCFEKLADIIDSDYDYIYNQWLLCDE